MGMTDAVLFFAYALCFWFGGWLIENEYKSIEEFDTIYKAIMGVIFGAIVLGQNSSFMPNFAEATLSSNKMFKLFNTRSKISPFDDNGQKPKNCEGALTFRKSKFFYPTRPDAKILRNFNVDIKTGQMVAIVGQSGQGKSTIIQLIERFYDINRGSVKLDDVELRDLSVNWLRNQIGIVGQEPVLFNMTIRQNIRYG